MFKYFTIRYIFHYSHRQTIVNWPLILFSFRFTPVCNYYFIFIPFERVAVADLFNCSLALSADATCQNMKIKIPESSEFMNI